MQSNFKFKHKNCLRRCNILSLMSFQNCSEKNLFFSFFFMVVILSLSLNSMAPFYGWGSTASRLEPLRGGSLLFTTKFPEVPGTHSIDLGRMKG